MAIAARMAGLPNIDQGSLHGTAVFVDYRAFYVDHFARGTSGGSVDDRQVIIVIKTSFGKFNLKRSRIKEVRRDGNPYKIDWEERYRKASKVRDVPALMAAARFAKENVLLARGRPDPIHFG